jgi:hypothetical protein
MSSPNFRSPDDVDSWNITLYPEVLVPFFQPFAPIQLVSYVPIARDHSTFKDWVSAGQAVAIIKIPPQYKAALIDSLKALNIAVLASTYPLALSQGNHVITCGTFIRCLLNADVDCVRVQAYGMKMSLSTHTDLGILPELGEPEHPLSHLNTFDLGVSHTESHMTLVMNRHDGIPGLKHYTILNPISKGYGGLQMPVKYDGQTFKVKIYPRIVHQIKAQAGKHLLTKPRTFEMCPRRRKVQLGHLAKMQALSGNELGGLRSDATVQCPTLKLAISKVSATPCNGEDGVGNR